MEPGGRKLLPRVQQPPGVERDSESVAAEALKNGNGIVDAPRPDRNAAWRYSVEEEGAPKRKRQHVEDNSPRNHALPGFRQMMPTPSHQPAAELDRNGPNRLVRNATGAYSQQGMFKFLASRTPREFPPSISQDPRELSFAVVEPELMEVFKHAYYLRHHIRHKRLSGELWFDHIYFNDAYAIDNILRTWISRYEPGMLQYPASILYKQCLWIFFNRSIQVSQSTAAFRHMVDDGLHFLRTFENELGATGDRSVLLVPIFLLGSTSFYAGQRQEIWTSLNRLDPSYSIDTVTHAARSLERIWEMMDDGRVAVTWDWEKYQAHDCTMAQADRSLIELLWDPLAPPPQVARARSPEAYDFDPGRFRAAPGPMPQPYPQNQPPPSAAPEGMRSQQPEAEEFTPPENQTPARHHSTASAEVEPMRVDANQEHHPHVELTAGPRPFLAPPPPSASMSNSDIIQVLHRKSSKAKSSVPPCPTCGKELKNPSDAQCREPGCTRTQGFATENDLQRHRKSVHGASPRIGNKVGYICAACPDPSDGTNRKWWPRLDNFKAHIRRKHTDADEESLIQACVKINLPVTPSRLTNAISSASARRPEDAYSEHSYRHQQSLRSSRTDASSMEQQDRGHSRSKSYEQDEYGRDDSNEGQDQADNSEGADRTPKSESSLSSSAEAMDVSPSGEQNEED
ncbi:hypothetical protein LTR37_007944 [Vermiconidia calcicola]|uniref:Uncharacterized protein n=1 Tax=Vermiconidia calcicola TaxID=1690605 RepID=A0ACC3NCF8_9PEZI|nr:hypothetical protein LTR37_007944 [Vermiconidia calcicola]